MNDTISTALLTKDAEYAEKFGNFMYDGYDILPVDAPCVTLNDMVSPG